MASASSTRRPSSSARSRPARPPSRSSSTATGLARPTAHRLAVALEHHRLVTRDMQGRFVLGPRLGELAAAAGEDRLLAAAGPVLGALRDHTNESAQLFRRQGDHRVCVSAAERPVGLRDSIPVGSRRCPCAPGPPPRCCSPGRSPTACTAACRAPPSPRRPCPACAAAAGPRASASARPASPRCRPRCAAPPAGSSPPCRSPGPIERLSRQPGRLHAATVIAGANKLTEVLRPPRRAATAAERLTAPGPPTPGMPRGRPATRHTDVLPPRAGHGRRTGGSGAHADLPRAWTTPTRRS